MNEYGEGTQEQPDGAETAELGLTDINLARRQCELQSATAPEQIYGMLSALTEAKKYAFSDEPLDPEGIKELVGQLGRLVEPELASAWRKVPVSFQNGDLGESPRNIDRAIISWAEAYATGALEPAELYYHFEKIHPFLDGNGRVGHCIWALAEKRQKGAWPTELPPDVFAEGRNTQPRSAFGEAEN